MQFLLLLPRQASPPSSHCESSESLLPTIPDPRNGGGECARWRASLADGGYKKAGAPSFAGVQRSVVGLSVGRQVGKVRVGLLFKETISITLFHKRTLPILYHCIGCFEVQCQSLST